MNVSQWQMLLRTTSSCHGDLLGRQEGRTDVDAVVVPVRPRHVLVDVRVDPRHVERFFDYATVPLAVDWSAMRLQSFRGVGQVGLRRR